MVVVKRNVTTKEFELKRLIKKKKFPCFSSSNVQITCVLLLFSVLLVLLTRVKDLNVPPLLVNTLSFGTRIGPW